MCGGNKQEIGPHTVKSVSFLQNLVTNLAETEKGERNAAAQQRRAETRALIAAKTHEECANVRRALKQGEGDHDGEWWVPSLYSSV